MKAVRMVAIALAIAVSGALVTGAGIDVVPGGTWVRSGDLADARSGASATLLSDGSVLVAGGEVDGSPAASAELFADGDFTPAAPLTSSRSGHTATLLPDGSVLAAGGTGTPSAEIYDPVSDAWTPLIYAMAEARSGHTASLLPDGRVLLAGGQTPIGPSPGVEVFDPATGLFTYAGTMSVPRTGHAAAALHDGRVLLTGGSFGGLFPSQTTDVFDPTAGLLAGPAMETGRAGHSATPLADGRILVSGGHDGLRELSSAELLSADGAAFTPAAPMAEARSGHRAFLLPHNNGVLLVGGTSASAEIFQPWREAFTPTAPPTGPRAAAAGSPLAAEGILLLAAGGDATSELYGFATVSTDRSDYAPGEIVTITGGGWQPGETVTLVLHELDNPEPHEDTLLAATADSSGYILNAEYSPEVHDLGITFGLMAIGTESGLEAWTTFTDGNVRSATAPLFFETDCVTAGTSFGLGTEVCASTTIEVRTPPAPATGDFRIQWVNPSGTVVREITASGVDGSTNVDRFTPSAFGEWTVRICPPNGSCNNLFNEAAFSVTAPTATSVMNANATYGAGAVTLSATVASSSAVNAGTVTFTLKNGATTIGSPTTSGSVSGGSASVSYALPSGTPADSYTVEAAYSGTPSIAPSSGTGTLTIAPLGISGSFTAADKVYDGTTDAMVTDRFLTGVLVGDDVTLDGGTASFPDKHVGAGKLVTLTGATLAGASAGNYTLTGVDTTTASITALEITGSFTAENKVYDRTTDARVTGRFLTGVVVGDDVVLDDGAATFADWNVGLDKVVTLTGAALGGTDAGNYSLLSVSTALADITRKPLMVLGITAADKPFDGTTSATLNLSGAVLDAVIAPDVVTLGTAGAAGAFASANVGSGIVVTIAGLTIGGADAGNYSLVQPTTTASITAWFLSGFYPPVGQVNTYAGSPMPNGATRWNTIKGGQTVPLKFELFRSVGGSELTSLADVTGFSLVSLVCTGGTEDAVDESFTTTGSTVLRYEDSQFIQNWQTPKGKKCYRVTMTARDGSQLSAFFMTK